jgi:ribulose-phosphate 3-epimerase
MAPIRIAPSILSADFGRLADELAELEAGGADLVHVDVMDGRFVPNITMGPPVISKLRKVSKLPFDVHLMIEEPDRHLASFRDAGADWISVHAEAVVHLHRTLTAIKDLGVQAGVAVNPGTPLCAVEEVLPWCHHVLLMSVNPGFGGQAFIPTATEKARRLSAMIAARGLPVVIEMDGGLDPATVGGPVAAGVSVVVAGSAILGRKDRKAAIADLRAACS